MTSSMHRHAGSERDVADVLAGGAVHEQHVLVACRRLQLLALKRLAQPLDARRAHAHRAADLRGQLLQRGLHDEPPAVDDQHLVDRLCDLCQHMAGDQHGAPP